MGHSKWCIYCVQGLEGGVLLDQCSSSGGSQRQYTVSEVESGLASHFGSLLALQGLLGPSWTCPPPPIAHQAPTTDCTASFPARGPQSHPPLIAEGQAQVKAQPKLKAQGPVTMGQWSLWHSLGAAGACTGNTSVHGCSALDPLDFCLTPAIA